MNKEIRKKSFLQQKINIIILIILLFMIILTIIFVPKKTNIEKKVKSIPNQDQVIKEILSYNLDKEIDQKFLGWMDKKYPQSLTKINEKLKNNTYNNSTWHDITGSSLIVLKDTYNEIYNNQDNVKEINTKDKMATINFIGDVSLADNWYIMSEYDNRSQGILGILSPSVVDNLTSSTLTIANNEFTVSNRGEKLPNKYYTFKASPQRLKIYKEMGVDLVTIANNHVYDFGKTAFLDMLDALDEYKIPHIGAGKNLEEASKPYYFIINGYKYAFLNANRSEKNILTPEATSTQPGVLRCYDPEYFTNLIKTTKKNSDYVIALLHWGKEDSHELEQVQKETSKIYIDAGADLIIGTHAHVLQGIDFYQDKAIIYNLGDFIFNNETKDTGIFQLKIEKDGTFKYYFIPAKESNEYTDLLTGKEKTRVLNEISSWSPNINIDDKGEITNANKK